MPVLITARLGSARLPQKHLQELGPGKPAIVCLIDRLRGAGLPLILCIPAGAEDEPLRDLAAAASIGCFAGDRDNVLLRYAQAMADRALEAAIIVDADDLFVSVEAVRKLAKIYAGEDMIRCAGMAYGGAPYLLSRAFVASMLAAGASPQGWSAWLDRVPGSKRMVDDFAVTPDEQHYRLSLDYPEDLAFLRELYRCGGADMSHAQLIAFITAQRAPLQRRFPSLFDGSLAARALGHLGAGHAP